MKIICPGHNGLIDVPSKELSNSLNSPVKGFIFNCPICEDEVLITNIQKDIINDVTSRNNILNRKKVSKITSY